MVREESHNEVVRRQFRVQAPNFEPYISSAGTRDVMSWILENLELRPSLTVLDVAAGTSLVGRQIAPKVAQVTALDATPEMLAQGHNQAESEGLANITFEEGDASRLPYPDDSFDLVTCRLGMHHFEDPAEQAQEMARVCRPGGRVAIMDVTTSEDREVACLHNRLERLRDPSHTHALTVNDLQDLLQKCGLDIVVSSTFTADRTVESWMDLTDTGPEARETIFQEMERELAGGPATGMYPFRRDGQLRFHHHWIMLVGQKATG